MQGGLSPRACVRDCGVPADEQNLLAGNANDGDLIERNNIGLIPFSSDRAGMPVVALCLH